MSVLSADEGNMLVYHMVLFKLPEGLQEADIKNWFGQLTALQNKVPGIHTISWGKYGSKEGLNRQNTYGFVMTFPHAAARDNYLSEPQHEMVKASFADLVAKAGIKNSEDCVTAFDFEAGRPLTPRSGSEAIRTRLNNQSLSLTAEEVAEARRHVERWIGEVRAGQHKQATLFAQPVTTAPSMAELQDLLRTLNELDQSSATPGGDRGMLLS